MDVDKQMVLLCTLLPFASQEQLTEGLQEASIALLLRARELRFQVAGGPTHVCPIDKLVASEWLALVGVPFCKPVALLNSAYLPVGIRLYLLKDALPLDNLCDPVFMSFESQLSASIREARYVLESQDKPKRRTTPDLMLKSTSIQTTVRVAEDLFWSFEALLFTRDPGPPIKVDFNCSAIVAAGTDHWRATILQHVNAIVSPTRARGLKSTCDGLLSAPSITLVITNNCAAWATACASAGLAAVHVDSEGMPTSVASQSDLVALVTPSLVAANLVNGEGLLDALDTAITSGEVLHMGLSRPQLIRYIIDKLSKKWANFVLPIALYQPGAVIVDDIMHADILSARALLDIRPTSKVLQIIHDRLQVKPKGLTREQVATAVWGLGPMKWSCVPAISHLVDQHCITVPVPKTLLRKFKVFGHVIKNSVIEEKIAKTFARRFCPLPTADAVQRFSSKPMTPATAKALIARHFERLECSLGSYVQDAPVAKLSREFVNKALAAGTPQACAVCFEALDHEYIVTICGHIYCSDCTRQWFHTEWSVYASKDCAACRAPLLLGDAIHVDASKAVLPTSLSSKQYGIQNFVGGLRATTVEMLTGPQRSAVAGTVWPKHVIVPDLQVVRAIDVLRLFADSPSQTSIQVFYGPSEQAAYEAFADQF